MQVAIPPEENLPAGQAVQLMLLKPKSWLQVIHMVLELQVAQPEGQVVHWVSFMRAKVPVAHLEQILPLRTYMGSQLVQDVPLVSVQSTHPSGQGVQMLPPAGEKKPISQAAQRPVLTSKPASQVMQLVELLQVAQLLGQVVQEEAPASEKVPSRQSTQESLTDCCWAKHCSQTPLEAMPKPVSQLWQAVLLVQLVQLPGQVEQLASPGLE